jgi:uncharacterized protein YjbI with pentapeptide repeats
MAMGQPEIKNDAMYQLLRAGQIADFNARKTRGESGELQGADLCGADLRNLDAAGLDLGDAYLRHADLRGVDFSTTRLEGASLYGARISGTYFPRELSAEEINLSLVHGPRLRYRA